MCSLLVRLTRRKPLLHKNRSVESMTETKLQLDNPKDIWNNVLWIGETNVELSGLNANRLKHHGPPCNSVEAVRGKREAICPASAAVAWSLKCCHET